MATREYRPMLMDTAKEIPLGNKWQYELKFDGFRAIAYVEGGICRLKSRASKDFTERFQSVADAMPAAFDVEDAVFDGEVVAQDKYGLHCLSNLRRRQGVLAYYIFDMLELNGQPLIRLTLQKRQEMLRKVYRGGVHIFLSQTFDVRQLSQVVLDMDLEGIVAKRITSPYVPGRRMDCWQKIKTRRRSS